jgi:hypothetical protein
MDGAKFQFLGRRQRRRALLRKRRPAATSRRRHDPMLVLNMSAFNFADGWGRTFSKLHENIT